MPNRILREGILTSERVNLLGWPAEVFYRRLHSVVDDFGRYYAKPELLRAACYPLQLDKVGNSDIGKWLEATRKAALVRTYTVDGKEYLELLDFRQQVRAKDSKFPQPPSVCVADAQQPLANAHLDVDVSVVVSEGDVMSGKPDAAPLNGRNYRQEAKEVLDYLNRNAGRTFREVDANLDLIVARLKSGVTALQAKEVIHAKCQQWAKDEKMAQYLRPETLFGKLKFEQYIGEISNV